MKKSTRRTFRVSEEFCEKLELIKKRQNADELHMTNDQLFDDMIDLYYARLVAKEHSVLFAEETEILLRNTLKEFTEMNAKFHNALLEQIEKDLLSKK